MASFIVHVSVGLLALFFPSTLSPWPFMIGAGFPDLEYLPIAIISLLKARDPKKAMLMGRKMMLMHTLIGTALIGVPLCYFASILIFSDLSAGVVLLSVVLGLLSHHLLDIPAHREFLFFWPIKVFVNDRYYIKPIKPIEDLYMRFYPKGLRTASYDLYFFNYMLISHLLIPLIVLAVLFLR